jgi:hypothetical protein
LVQQKSSPAVQMPTWRRPGRPTAGLSLVAEGIRPAAGARFLAGSAARPVSGDVSVARSRPMRHYPLTVPVGSAAIARKSSCLGDAVG